MTISAYDPKLLHPLFPRFCPCRDCPYYLGSPTSYTANRLIRNIVYLMPWGFEDFLLVTTDKLAAYEKAIANCLKKVRASLSEDRQATSKQETDYSQKEDTQG